MRRMFSGLKGMRCEKGLSFGDWRPRCSLPSRLMVRLVVLRLHHVSCIFEYALVGLELQGTKLVAPGVFSYSSSHFLYRAKMCVVTIWRKKTETLDHSDGLLLGCSSEEHVLKPYISLIPVCKCYCDERNSLKVTRIPL